MTTANHQTVEASALSLLWFAFAIPQNLGNPFGPEDEPFHRHPEGKGNEFEPTVEYDEETYPVRRPRTAAAIKAELIRHEIIPEFILVPPKYEAFVTYYNSCNVDMGNTIRPSKVKFPPHTVTYKFKPDSLFTIVMTGLDEPSKASPTKREFLHWIVGNVLADQNLGGDLITEYYPVSPLKDTGLHRYLFLVYEQRNKIDFKEPLLTNRNNWGRANWSSRKFAEKYKLGEPHAANFFYSECPNVTIVSTTPGVYKTSLFYPNTNEPI